MQSSNLPIERGINEPPHYVILDDRACWEVLQSDIKKAEHFRYWAHDFAGPAIVRYVALLPTMVFPIVLIHFTAKAVPIVVELRS